MSKTYEQIKRMHEDGSLNVSLCGYVKPLLDKIAELEKEVEQLEFEAWSHGNIGASEF